MIPAYGLSLLVALGMIAHCIKTGRNRIWIYVLMFTLWMPFVGSAVYACVEILPDLLRTRTSQKGLAARTESSQGAPDCHARASTTPAAVRSTTITTTPATSSQYAHSMARAL